MTDRCLACHVEIAWYRTERRGLHARVANLECARCHPDHAGRDFDLVHWEEGSERRFHHDRAGWPLTGAHAATACRSCHRVEHQRASVVAKLRKADHRTSWLGLETECLSCHADPHKGRFGDACGRCHRTGTWSAIDKDGFDHDRTRYPLRGRHAGLACARCHDPEKAWGEKPAFSSCGSCHADAHAGRATIGGAPADCAACHDVAGFSRSTFTAAMHRKSRYPLEGAHGAVACGACHLRRKGAAGGGSFGPAAVDLHPTSERCESCHANPHAGQTLARSNRTRCADCHTVDRFAPSTFRVPDHANLRLSLDGRHETIACRACHAVDRAGLARPEGANRAGRAAFVFALTDLRCGACHVDPHRGRLPKGCAREASEACRTCHTTDAFRPATFDVARHDRYVFPLDGAHRAVLCADCHEDLKQRPRMSSLDRSGRSMKSLTFEVKAAACASCHTDPHGGQFRTRKDHGACEACHDTETFRPASRFDHDRGTSFSLKGAHAGVTCERCHGSESDRTGKRRVLYRGISGRCEDCHAS